MAGTNMRIVILGKTGVGRSSLGNTIFGESVFTMGHFSKSETTSCKAESRSVKERSITLIDTPGLFDTEKSEEELKPEILRCITECAPELHAFLIVLKVETYTDQDDIITKLCQYFSEEALRYAAVVFTHGDQLPEGMEIQEFIKRSEGLSDIVKKCGDRCHVVDNKYWNNDQQDPYRSNHFQVAELLNTVDKIVEDNKGGCYTNELLQAVGREIQEKMENITKSSGNLSKEEIREKAKIRTLVDYLSKNAYSFYTNVKEKLYKVVRQEGAVKRSAQEEKSGAVGGTGEFVSLSVPTTEDVSGGVEEAETAGEPAEKAAEAGRNEAEPALCQKKDHTL